MNFYDSFLFRFSFCGVFVQKDKKKKQQITYRTQIKQIFKLLLEYLAELISLGRLNVR